MIREKRNTLPPKVFGLLLLCAGSIFAGYIEGTDTTDANGFGLDSTFRVINGYLVGLNGGVDYWFYTGSAAGYYNYSFDDIKTAPNPPLQSYFPPSGVVFYCVVGKRKKDSTYSKVQPLQQISGNRYLFKYGTNTTPNDRMLERADYDRSIRYKPNNLYNCPSPYPNPVAHDTMSWEPPLPNDNHLIGYIFYMSKTSVIIDTTAPINPAQWDSIAFFTSTKVYNPDIIFTRRGCYFNLVAVYAEGKSDFLLGWSKSEYTLVDVKQKTPASDLILNKIAVKKTDGGFLITLQAYRPNTGSLSLAVFNAAGVKVAQFSPIKGNSAIWKTDNLAEGVYLIRAELTDRSVLTQTIVLTR